jgi:hypothetical protein
VAWFETISSALGAGAPGVALAGAIYAGSIALENEMRVEAKKDIARFVNNARINPSSQATANFIVHAFETVFGPRHWTINCAIRSAVASTVFLVVMTLFVSIKMDISSIGIRDVAGTIMWLFIVIAVPAYFADYISLYKGRIILKIMQKKTNIAKMCLFVFIDILASLSIGISVYYLYQCIWNASFVKTAYSMLSYIKHLVFGIPTGEWLSFLGEIPLEIFLLSTLMTSLWTVLIMLSSGALKIGGSANVLMRFVRWMFDVDAHPVRVIGLVAAVFVWAGSVVYGAL